jgi:cell wall-associated NlpC family hydrolase
MSPSLATGRLRYALLLSAIVVAAAPAAQAQETKPFAALSNSAAALRDSVVQMARAQIGRSGLVHYVMAALNLKLPRTARQQAAQGLAIGRDTSRLLPGDLLTFGKGKKGVVSHVGIYVGDGRYVHASSVAGKVIESSIDRPFSPLIKIWRDTRRVLAFNDTTAPPDTAPQKPRN